MLPKINRLTGEEDFRKVSRSGKRSSCYLFDLTVLDKGKTDNSRFGFVVSNKISKKAVLRNRAKRLLREGVFELSKSLLFGHDYIFYAKKPILETNLPILKNEIARAVGIQNPEKDEKNSS